jgi:hypothetical protein
MQRASERISAAGILPSMSRHPGMCEADSPVEMQA